MSQEKLIIVTVQLDGTLAIQPQGYNGKGCKKDTEVLEELLGNVTSQELEADYFTAPTTQQTQQFE